MPRRRRPKSALDLTFGILPPFIGLFVLSWAFSPQFRVIVGRVLTLILIGSVIVLAALIIRAIYRRRAESENPPGGAETIPPSLPLKFPNPSRSTPRPAPVPEWSLELLRSLEWKRFEELVCAYIRELGYQARTTRLGADGGVDVEVIEPTSNALAMVVQCKAWNTYQVGIKPVRELYGVMASRKVPQAAFFTTGTYTTEALAFGKQHDVDLVDGAELLLRISQLKLSQSLQLLEDATRGDYTTPSCPRCGTKMLIRTASQGASEGSQFWGCASYPRCRQTFKVPVQTT